MECFPQSSAFLDFFLWSAVYLLYMYHYLRIKEADSITAVCRVFLCLKLYSHGNWTSNNWNELRRNLQVESICSSVKTKVKQYRDAIHWYNCRIQLLPVVFLLSPNPNALMYLSLQNWPERIGVNKSRDSFNASVFDILQHTLNVQALFWGHYTTDVFIRSLSVRIRALKNPNN